MKHRMGFTSITLIIGFVLCFSGYAYAEQMVPVIKYDKNSDELSVSAKESSYRDVMANIASMTGVEILMDPKAERQVTVNMSKTPLEKALKDISRESSVAFVYSDIKIEDSQKKTSTTKSVITSMQILPKGESSTANLQPLLLPSGEAFIREKGRILQPGQRPTIFDFSQKRWEARLEKMPPDKRATLLAEARDKVDHVTTKKEENKKEREANDKKREERVRQHDAREQAHLERLRESNPELYQIRMQRYEESKQQKNQTQQ